MGAGGDDTSAVVFADDGSAAMHAMLDVHAVLVDGTNFAVGPDAGASSLFSETVSTGRGSAVGGVSRCAGLFRCFRASQVCRLSQPFPGLPAVEPLLAVETRLAGGFPDARWWKAWRRFRFWLMWFRAWTRRSSGQ